MYSIRYNSAKNHLYLTFQGMLLPDEIDAATNQGIKIINDHLSIGFDVVTETWLYASGSSNPKLR